MKSIKKMILMLICISLICCLYTGCTEKSESTGPEGNSLVGTWMLTKMSMVFAGFTVDIDPAETGLMITLKINADGTYSSATTDEGVTTTVNGTWSSNNNVLTVTEDGETSEMDYSLSGDELIFTFDEEDDGQTFTMIQEYRRQ